MSYSPHDELNEKKESSFEKMSELNVKQTDSTNIQPVKKKSTIGKRISDPVRSEKRFRKLIENGADAIVLLDSAGIVKYLSPAYAKIMGRDDLHRIGSESIEFIHPGDYAIYKGTFEKILSNPGIPVKFILRNQHSNGRWLRLECIANNLLNEPGIHGIVVNIHDDTVRWNAEEALRKSEGLYADLVLNQVAGVYRILSIKHNPDQPIWNVLMLEFVSDRFCDIIGIKNSDIDQIPSSIVFDSIHPDDRQDFIIANEEANQNFTPFTWEGRIINNNTTKWVRFDSNPRKLDDGSIRWTGVIVDITRQKQVEEQLKKNSHRLMRLNDCLSSLGTDYDLNINRLTALSGALLNATFAQYNRLENGCFFTAGKWQLPEGYPERISPDGYLGYDVILDNSDKTITISDLPGTSYANTDPNVLAYGLQTYCAHVVRREGIPVGSLCVIYNHTCEISAEDQKIIGIIASAIGNEDNRKHYIEALKASEAKLKDLNATKDRFFSIIAHDLKGPFNGIIGLSEILTEDAKNLDISTIVDYARMINASALQTLRLLDNLLKWARMQEGKMAFNPVRNVLHKVVDEVIILFAYPAERKKIVLVNQVPTQMTVDADTEMLKTILRNLISNAVKFTNANGTVSIEATNADSWVEIVVADNGSGIRAEDIGKLFKVDIAFSTRGTENERGTGLGLILCKEFVEKHGGIITVESQPGKGSRFKLTFPYKTVESNEN